MGIVEREIQKAKKRIERAIRSREKVIVYGDYDADGVCATAIMWEALRAKGAEVMPLIPRREEGYGLNKERVKELKKGGVKLIVTVDQGIVQNEAAREAKKRGVDLIVTDHHLPGKVRPEAVAIIHTTGLSGAGAAWFLAKNLGVKKDFLALATIGTVTDLVPLLGANRSLVKFGLLELAKAKRPGLRALYRMAGLNKKELSTYEVSFLLGPRLNSSGRLADPLDSLRLICTRNQERADKLAESIEQSNRERQELMMETTRHARELWFRTGGEESLIFVGDESYHEGVIGLAAGKLSEEFGRPAVVLAKKDKFTKASARSIEGFNIVEAIRHCADIVGAHGGHPLAAGFTVETAKIEILKTRLQNLAATQLPAEKLGRVLKVETFARFAQLNKSLWKEMQKLEPFGEGNRQPVLATKDVEVVDKRLMGSEGQHAKLRLQEMSSGLVIEAVGFSLAGQLAEIKVGAKVDVAYNLMMNEWNGSKKLQLRIKDIKIKSENE